ncbi:MAG: hypothetical protein WBF87_13445 [Mesorhizobium sp.]
MLRLIFTLLASIVTMPWVAEVTAADVTRVETSLCFARLSGEIVSGDYDRFVLEVAPLFPGNDGESTHRNTICLDSPGGNLAEGVKFARYFYREGVGTVIADGDSCFSACAIMFMMGTATGDEVAFANRKLHVNGVLGFHRPFLKITSHESVDARLLRIAADGAFSSALDLIDVANSRIPWTGIPMMKPDLVQGMLRHQGQDFLLVDTTDEVGRWGIELIGAVLPTKLTEEAAFYACENSLQWAVGLTEEDIAYSKHAEPHPGYRRVKRIVGNGGLHGFSVEGLASGYVAEGCIIHKREGRIYGCGEDESTDTKLGQGACDAGNFEEKATLLRSISLVDPSTALRSLARSQDEARSDSIRCIVRRGSEVIDDERCAAETKAGGLLVFIWPSGGRTVLTHRDGKFEVNGIPTQPISTGSLICLLNSKTGNEFCYESP